MGTVNFQQLTGVQSSLQISSDYLFAGNVIGEMGLLTDSVRNASVTCETTVQVSLSTLLIYLTSCTLLTLRFKNYTKIHLAFNFYLQRGIRYSNKLFPWYKILFTKVNRKDVLNCIRTNC